MFLQFHPLFLLLLQYNFIPNSFCCYSTVVYSVHTTSSSISIVATVQCTVYSVILYYSCCYIQPLPFNPFLATEQPHPLFVMLLQPYPVLFSVATSNSINSSSIPFVATISSSISSVTTLFSNICYYNLILFS